MTFGPSRKRSDDHVATGAMFHHPHSRTDAQNLAAGRGASASCTRFMLAVHLVSLPAFGFGAGIRVVKPSPVRQPASKEMRVIC